MFPKAPKPRLIDDTGFAIQRVKPHVEKDEPQFRSARHLKWIGTLPCILAKTGLCSGAIEAAHLRIDGTDGGGSVKPSDYFTSPQCGFHHKLSHTTGERTLWAQVSNDPWDYVLRIAMHSPDPRASELAQTLLLAGDTRPLSAPGVHP